MQRVRTLRHTEGRLASIDVDGRLVGLLDALGMDALAKAAPDGHTDRRRHHGNTMRSTLPSPGAAPRLTLDV